MSVEAIAAAASALAGGGAEGQRAMELLPPGGGGTAISPQAEARFQQAIEKLGGVEGTVPVGSLPGPLKGMFAALDQVNVQARSVSDYAQAAEASGGQLTPGEIVQLTMKCQEFMFQAQLTSNIANRSSDGVQQLFKQQ
ncbi:hypothetical protein LZK98_06065 [Sphingomonas cannabina]|uniref:hypothetical protein n=1 Tax=Sphingomonas cannabina TaxID=2899123 RepID=UPI001F1DFE09|nr:hypothetical protein [Sphingomonas cannabina]UIJ46512.1 hypothetical protein LZK98_06065 [Sphingomonas cannabina]